MSLVALPAFRIILETRGEMDAFCAALTQAAEATQDVERQKLYVEARTAIENHIRDASDDPLVPSEG